MEEHTISFMKDEEILAIPEVAQLLDAKRRNTPLTFAELKTLVKALQPGMARPANLERFGEFWRLRFTLQPEMGRCIRRSVVIDDPLVKDWVADYIDWARSKRRKYRFEATSRRLRERWESSSWRFVESIMSRADIPALDGMASDNPESVT